MASQRRRTVEKVSEFSEFVDRYFSDGEVPVLAPWQIKMVEKIASGDQFVINMPRRHDTRRLSRMAAALAELQNKKWDAVASRPEEAQRMRRQAREDAAAIASGQFPRF